LSARGEKTKEENSSVTEQWCYVEITSGQKLMSVSDGETITA
jgi:hypothetical protein